MDETNEINGDGRWGVDLSESTADPSISMIAEDVPTLTLATILAVTIVIVIAIVVVFVLGVLIDCRQKRMLDRQIEQMKRNKKYKRSKTRTLTDVVSIAENMEESGTSPAPAEMLREIP